MKKRLKFFLGASAFAALSAADVGCMQVVEDSCDPHYSITGALLECGFEGAFVESVAQCVGERNIEVADSVVALLEVVKERGLESLPVASAFSGKFLWILGRT